MAFTNYVIISNTGAIGGGKKLDVLLATWRELRRPVSVRNTLNDKAYAVLPAGWTPWSFRIQVQDLPKSGYFSRSEVNALFAPTSAATALLKFQDIWSVVWDVAQVGIVDLLPALAPVMEGGDGWYEGDVVLRRRL